MGGKAHECGLYHGSIAMQWTHIQSDRIRIPHWHRACPLVGIKLTVSAIEHTHG
jgi:hypothetical protein